MHAVTDNQWPTWQSDAGRWWASRRVAFTPAQEHAGCWRTVDADSAEELSAAIAEQHPARLRHASAKTTLDTNAPLWPGRDESTRAAIDAVLMARTEQRRNAERAR